MSQTTTPPPQPALTPAEAKAAARAAKAYAKSLRPWYKKKRFIVPGALVALIVVGSAVSGGGADDADSATGGDVSTAADVSDAEAAQAAETAAGVGTPVRDGQFEFIVNGVECGANQVGDEFFNKQAQGQFCLLALTVTNIGDEAQYFFGENVTLYNAAGQEYSADTEASIYVDESSSIFEEINPGNTLTGTVVFDIPAGASPVEVELHDSAFSGGVKVTLT